LKEEQKEGNKKLILNVYILSIFHWLSSFAFFKNSVYHLLYLTFWFIILVYNSGSVLLQEILFENHTGSFSVDAFLLSFLYYLSKIKLLF